MRERDLQDAVTMLARTLGWLAYHTHDSRRSAAGFPDLVLVHPRQERIVYAELKTEDGHATGDQLEWLKALELAGADVHLWRPHDWHDGRVEAILRPARV